MKNFFWKKIFFWCQKNFSGARKIFWKFSEIFRNFLVGFSSILGPDFRRFSDPIFVRIFRKILLGFSSIFRSDFLTPGKIFSGKKFFSGVMKNFFPEKNFFLVPWKIFSGKKFFVVWFWKNFFVVRKKFSWGLRLKKFFRKLCQTLRQPRKTYPASVFGVLDRFFPKMNFRKIFVTDRCRFGCYLPRQWY